MGLRDFRAGTRVGDPRVGLRGARPDLPAATVLGDVRSPCGCTFYSDLSSVTSPVRELSAAPKRIEVLGWTKSAFSIPANPAPLPRLSTMTERAWSTLRIGIP